MEKRLDAHEEVMAMMADGETPETIIFGDWGGYGGPLPTHQRWESDRDGWGDEPKPARFLIPPKDIGVTINWDDAVERGHLNGWSFVGGFGSPNCYAVTIWSNMRVIFVSEYDGATELLSVPRTPSVGHIPTMV